MNVIITKIKDGFKYILTNLQLTGACLLIASFVMAFLNMIMFAWITLACVGLLDLYLIYIAKVIRITDWIRALWGHAIDNVVMIGLVVLVWWLKGETIALWFLLGLLNNHLFEKD
jgi:hypothetical protein